MKRFASVAAICGILLTSSSAWAAGIDHLQCHKIKDAIAKTSYTADITPNDPAFAAAAGCSILLPAKLLCLGATKSNVTPTPPGSPDGQPTQGFLCYKTKCPKDQPAGSYSDQFGTHAITAKATGYVCAPLAPSCSDSIADGAETDVDCGGGTCPACADGEGCGIDSDCTSGNCAGGICTTAMPTCSDGMQNGNETDVDCGGGSCPDCADGDGCLLGSDCTSGVCLGGTCTAAMPTCTDNTQNGSETGTDCGGGTCPDCVNGEGCAADSDCISNYCSGGMCTALLANASPCSGSSQCSSGSCVDGVCCDSPCSGVCQACTAAKKGGGMNGVCGNINVGSDPDNECLAQATASCGTTGVCSGTGSCQLYSNATVCALGSCSSSTQQQSASLCDGAGTCVPGGTTNCSPYSCTGTQCNSMCSDDSACDTPSFTCISGTCQ